MKLRLALRRDASGSGSETYRLHVAPARRLGLLRRSSAGNALGWRPGRAPRWLRNTRLSRLRSTPGIRFSTSARPSEFFRSQVAQAAMQRSSGIARDFELVQVGRALLPPTVPSVEFFGERGGVGEEHLRPVAGGGLEMHFLVVQRRVPGASRRRPWFGRAVALRRVDLDRFAAFACRGDTGRFFAASVQNTRLPSLEIALRTFRPVAVAQRSPCPRFDRRRRPVREHAHELQRGLPAGPLEQSARARRRSGQTRPRMRTRHGCRSRR